MLPLICSSCNMVLKFEFWSRAIASVCLSCTMLPADVVKGNACLRFPLSVMSTNVCILYSCILFHVSLDHADNLVLFLLDHAVYVGVSHLLGQLVSLSATPHYQHLSVPLWCLFWQVRIAPLVEF